MSFQTAILKKNLSTALDFYEAPRPWAPWMKVKSFNTGLTGWYPPIVGQRFKTAVNSNAVTVHLYATGLTSKPEGGDQHEEA